MVVITNPTHYAIALEYERGMDAPVCVAKGVDAYTQRPVSHFTAVPFLDLPLSLSLTLKLLGSVVAMLAVVAAADYLFQYRQWHERQKMRPGS